jgi:hypothetical protein
MDHFLETKKWFMMVGEDNYVLEVCCFECLVFALSLYLKSFLLVKFIGCFESICFR